MTQNTELTTIIDAEFVETTAIALSEKAGNFSLEDAQQFFAVIIERALDDYKSKHKLTEATSDTEIIEEWLLIKAGKSKHTHRMYHTHINQFTCWLNKPLGEIKPTDLAKYQGYLEASKYSQNSVAVKIKAAKGLISYSNDVGYLQANAGKLFAGADFTEAASERVFKENTENNEDGELNKFLGVIENEQHKLIFQTLASTGLRAAELINLQWSNEIPNQPRLFCVTGKGNKTREVFLKPSIYEALKALKSDSDYIFANRNNGKFSYSYLYKLVKKYAIKAGINIKVSLHYFRHYFADSLRKAGVELYEISKLLGHATVVTTQKYFHSDKKDYTYLIEV
jgi:integrase/recombinase XerD